MKDSVRKPETYSAQDRATSILKKNDLRCGGARLAVLAFLIDAHRPLSSTEIIEALVSDDVSHAAVYRTLNTLVRKGIAREIESPKRNRLYEVHIEETCNDEHAHFICRGCGWIRCLEELALPSWPPFNLSKGFRVDEQRVYLYGFCPKCNEVKP